MKTFLSKKFKDVANYSPSERTAISVRDGVIEYLGAELQIEPADQVFTVYRSPATIANAAVKMPGIPLTDEHVALDEPPPETGSIVESASMVDAIDECTMTRIAVKNELSMLDSVMESLENKTQLSLGYFGDLIPHDKFDFEQVNIIPHHLAIVVEGRCGELCSFLDRKTNFTKKEQNEMKQHKAFVDAEGQVSLEKVVEIASSLPEAIKMLSLDDLQKVMPSLQGIVDMAQVKEVPTEDEDKEDKEDKEKEKVETKDEDMDEKDKPKFSDADFKDALEKKSKEFAKEFADTAVKEYSVIIDKARTFLDETYDFKGKTTSEIMKDALSTESASEFSDEELPMAFKLLKKTAEYKKFGDHKTEHPLDVIAKQEL